jgi:hypothetical protein
MAKTSFFFLLKKASLEQEITRGQTIQAERKSLKNLCMGIIVLIWLRFYMDFVSQD